MNSPVSHRTNVPDFTPLVEELPTQLEPWQVFQHFAHLPHVAFLDSAMFHPQHGRYSYIAADPFVWLTSRRHEVTIGGKVMPSKQADPLLWLARHLADYPCRQLADLPPFQGGAVAMFGYDLCHILERVPRHAIDDFKTPDVAVGLYDWVIAFDHVRQRSWIISNGWPALKRRGRQTRAAQRLRQVQRWLRANPKPGRVPPDNAPQNLAPCHPLPMGDSVVSNFEHKAYLRTLERAIEYIYAGDCFQVNIAQRLLSPAISSPLDLYGKLRTRNPATFAAYFDLGDFVIASASPERHLRVDHREVETRPIKGTRPRGATQLEDLAQRSELLASAKDRSENVMIVDLLRNDLGRVCEYGSIAVPALCNLESYQFVHHLVSEVRGRLRPDSGPIDLLRAAFPGGSVTGAPKIRAMEIIAELEPTARGPYCGSLGWIGFNGDMDTNIMIRTFTIGRGWVQFPVGGGIVADSDPQREYEETLHKAEGMLRALR